MIANYHSIETFSSVDGPGIRYVLFLQGCNLVCKFCHNPDMLTIKKNKEISVQEVVSDFLKYRTFYRNGGITISGGEPLLQIDFIIELFRELKKLNVHTCIETQGSLFVEGEKYQELVSLTDLFLVNLKGVDNDYSLDICGIKIDRTLEFLKYLDNLDHKFTITYVLLPGINDNEYCATEYARIISSYKQANVTFQVLPYHNMGIEKWDKLNIKYLLRDLREPKKDEVEAFVVRVKHQINEFIA